MTVSPGTNATAGLLLQAIGLLDADGQANPAFFQNPLGSITQILVDQAQRSALLELLGEVLPREPGTEIGSAWYALLDEPGLANVFLTVEGDRIGVAAGIATPVGAPTGARLSARLPLVQISGGELEAIATTPDGPLELALDLDLGSTGLATALRVSATVDITGDAGVRVEIEGVESGGVARTVTLSTDSTGAEIALALQTLVQAALEEFTGDATAGRLLGVLGLDATRPLLPIDRLFQDPAAIREWFAALAATPSHLRGWLGDLSQLLGGHAPAAGLPLRARVLELADDLWLELTAEVRGDDLLLGVQLSVGDDGRSLEVEAALLAIPLTAGRSVRAVPSVVAAVQVTGPTGGPLVAPPDPPTGPTAFGLGAIAGGVRFDGVQLQPELVLTDVVLAGQPHARLDLTDSGAVTQAVSGAIEDALRDALGDAGPALTLLALLGIIAPRTDPTATRRVDPAALGAGPLAALAAFHRGVLGDTAHPWSHLLGELGALFGIGTQVDGLGTEASPWTIELASTGGVRVDLAAWDARTADDAPGDHRLRIGFVAGATVDVWTSRLLSEVLAFDLPAAGPGDVRLIGRQAASTRVAPIPPAALADDLELRTAGAGLEASWAPGRPFVITAAIDDVTLVAGGAPVAGPVTLEFDPLASAVDDPSLGLGATAEEAWPLVRALAQYALRTWGGEGAAAVGSLLGLDDTLAPLALPDEDDLRALLREPGRVLRDRLIALLTAVDDDGRPVPERALAAVAALLRGELGGGTGAGSADPFGGVQVAVTGTGTYADPWALPLGPAGNEDDLELVAWLDPDGPPKAWAAALARRVTQAADAGALLALVRAARAFVPDLPAWDGHPGIAAGAERLAGWLAAGDGVVPLQIAAGALPGWTTGILPACPHDALPRSAPAIAAVQQALDAWAREDEAAAPVLLLGPSWTATGLWDDLLTAIVPGGVRPAGTSFDLRGRGPAAAAISGVTTVAGHYTAHLPAGTPTEVAAHLPAIVARISALTGAPRVVVVAHSAAGLAARAFAQDHPAAVRSIITLGTPHDGALPAPLTEPALADAVRVLRDLAGTGGEPFAVAALARLDGALAAAPGALHAPEIAPIPAGTTRGLALGSALGGDVLAAAGAALATRLEAVATAPGPAPGDATGRREPTHLGLGLRARLPLDVTDAGDVRVRARARLDALRVALDPAAPPPPRPPLALDVAIDLDRPGGWLAGDAHGTDGRVRALHAGVLLTPTAGGGVGTTPRLSLADASLPRIAASPADASSGDATIGRRDLDLLDPELARAIELLADGLGLDATAQLERLHQLVTTPAAALRDGRDALLAELGGPLTFAVAGTTIEVSLDPATWELRVRTGGELAFGDADGLGAGIAFDGRLALVGFRPRATGTLRVGAVELTADTATATVSLAADPWLAPLTVVPSPGPDALGAALLPLVPRIAVSAGLSAALRELLDLPAPVGSLDRLLADPGAALQRLAGDDVQALLQATAQALGLPDDDGLPLPGGVLLSASGADEITLRAAAAIDLDGPAGPTQNNLDLQLSLRVDPARRVHPAGGLTLTLDLPGTWAGLTVAFAVDELGVVRLAVTPEGGSAIQLLPTFDGFDELVTAGVTAILPSVLDELEDAFDPPGAFGEAVLDVADALGIRSDATGFTGPAEVARLRTMLSPGWLEAQIADPAALADLVAALFAPGRLPLPPGHTVTATAGVVRYLVPLPGAVGGAVTVEARLGEPVLIRVAATGVDVGPLVIEELRAGFDGDLDFGVRLRLDLDDDLAFLRPAAELAWDDGRLSAAILPLGATERADLELRLAPAPDATFTPEGVLGLLVAWGIPLATLIGLSAVGTDAGQPLDTPLWTAGPTVRSILTGAFVLEGPATPGATPVLAHPLRPLEEIALGALTALAQGATIRITDDLRVSVVQQDGRTGARLSGQQRISVDDGPDVSVIFGDTWWMDAADEGGITFWAFRAAPGSMPPIALDPGLDVTGLGAIVGDDPEADDAEPVVEGAVTVGGLGGVVFFSLDFLTDAGEPTIEVDGLGAGVQIDGAFITVSADDGDSFIKKILPKELQAPFDVAVEGREGSGIEIHGGIGATEGGIELTFPIDLDLGGVVYLKELLLAARREGAATTVLAAITGNAELGPLALNVERVGLRLRVDGGEVSLGFKPPDGFGVSLDTGVVRVGGYLFVDEQRGRYVGAVDISIAEKFSLVAVGIVTTKAPDGSELFSLLVLIGITFPVPIPLGYGFFFAGAGGLLGINRGIDLDRLRLGLRSGTADSILFPTDVIRNIDTIVRDLDESFPIAQGHFLVAPMAMITWSTPPLITAKVGIVIEIGSPLTIAVLGVLQLALPDPKTPVVNLKVAFLGALDIPGQMLSFDASIYDSTIGYGDFSLSLEGDMALRICWGPKPDFVITVGGFHPSFTPGSHLRLPPMRRMRLSLLKDNPRISLETYFAVTSNTVQFGAKLELYFSVAGFSIVGDAGFDVLVQIVPLRLEAHLWAHLSVRAGGTDILSIKLDLTVEGPTPWIAKGTASFSILFFSVDVELEVTVGDPAPATLPRIAVLEQLVDVFAADGSWSAELAGGNDLIALRPPAGGELVLDAAGQLTVQQRMLPLHRTFGLVGTAEPSDVSQVRVEELRIGNRAVSTATVTEAFAPAAFQKLSDQDKLSAPSFEQMPSGVQVDGGRALTTDAVLRHDVAYEVKVLDTPAVPPPAGSLPPEPVTLTGAAASAAAPSPEVFERLVPGGSIRASAGSVAQQRTAEKARFDLTPADERYVLVAAGTVTPVSPAGEVILSSADVVGATRSLAEQQRDALHAAGAGTFDLLPESQLVVSA